VGGRREAAAVEDHDGGPRRARNRAISQPGEIAPPATLQTAAIGMQKQPPIATVHHRNTKPHEASRAIAQFMGDPVSLRNGIGAKQSSSNFTVSRAIETAIKGAQGEDEPVSTDLGKRRWVGAWTAAVERAPKAQRSSHSDFEEPIEWQKDRRWMYAATVQMHPHLDSEALNDIVVTFSGQDGVKRQRLGLEFWMRKPWRKSG
jgi:hypothetical protein